MDAIKIGSAIKALRQRRSLTQKQLADYLGVTDKAVSKWERGIGIPDISMLGVLASILYVDVDALLDGSVTSLEDEWQGLLLLDDGYTPADIFGKPSVYFPLCYFLLVGIRTITICAPGNILDDLRQTLSSFPWLVSSIRFQCRTQNTALTLDHTMVIFNTPFLYGLNLTRFFQSAILSCRTASILTIPYQSDLGYGRMACSSAARFAAEEESGQPILPIFFFRACPQEPIRTESDILNVVMQRISEQQMRVIPLGNGMIFREIRSRQDVLEVSNLLYLLESFSGTEIYRPEDIARARGLIPFGKPSVD